MSYYYTCSKCDANLDPGERCDCEKMKPSLPNRPISDCLMVAYDDAKNGDHICFTVARRTNDKVQILNSYYDDEAIDMYNKLITQAPEGKIKHIL